jgi:hypothetical protein
MLCHAWCGIPVETAQRTKGEVSFENPFEVHGWGQPNCNPQGTASRDPNACLLLESRIWLVNRRRASFVLTNADVAKRDSRFFPHAPCLVRCGGRPGKPRTSWRASVVCPTAGGLQIIKSFRRTLSIGESTMPKKSVEERDLMQGRHVPFHPPTPPRASSWFSGTWLPDSSKQTNYDRTLLPTR